MMCMFKSHVVALQESFLVVSACGTVSVGEELFWWDVILMSEDLSETGLDDLLPLWCCFSVFRSVLLYQPYQPKIKFILSPGKNTRKE